MRVPLFFLAILLTAQVRGQSTLKTDEVLTIAVLNNPADKLSVQDLYADIEVIPLETSNEVLFGQVASLRHYKGTYYIHNGRPMNLLKFDETGRFLGKVAKRGNGPGEYPSLFDFEIDKDKGELLLYSNWMSIYHYNLEGDFISKQDLDFGASSFELLGNGQLAFYTNYRQDVYGSFNVLIASRSGEVEKQLAPFPTTVDRSIAFSGQFRAFGEQYYFNHAFSDTLWHFNEQFEVAEAFVFDFEGSEWRQGFDFRKPDLDASYLGKRFYANERFIFFNYLNNRFYRHAIYDHQAQKVYNEFAFKAPFLFRIINTPEAEIDVGTYISTINAQSLSWLINRYPDEWDAFQRDHPEIAKPLNTMLTDETNPVLIRFKIKQSP